MTLSRYALALLLSLPTAALGQESAPTEPAPQTSTEESGVSADVDAIEVPLALESPVLEDIKLDVAATLRATVASGDMGAMFGSRFTAFGNGRFLVGAAGYFTLIEPQLTLAPTPAGGTPTYSGNRFLTFGYIGPEIGYALHRESLFNVYGRLLLGYGRIGHNGTGNAVYEGTDTFWVVEPTVEMVVNLLERIKLGLGAGYRFGYGIDLKGAPPNANNRVNAADGLVFDANVQFLFF